MLCNIQYAMYYIITRFEACIMHALLALLLHRCCNFALDDLTKNAKVGFKRPSKVEVASTMTIVVTFSPNALNDRLKWLQV